MNSKPKEKCQRNVQFKAHEKGTNVFVYLNENDARGAFFSCCEKGQKKMLLVIKGIDICVCFFFVCSCARVGSGNKCDKNPKIDNEFLFHHVNSCSFISSSNSNLTSSAHFEINSCFVCKKLNEKAMKRIHYFAWLQFSEMCTSADAKTRFKLKLFFLFLFRFSSVLVCAVFRSHDDDLMRKEIFIWSTRELIKNTQIANSQQMVLS